MLRKSGNRLSEKIVLKQGAELKQGCADDRIFGAGGIARHVPCPARAPSTEDRMTPGVAGRDGK
jgi:hypothetical protein